MTTDRIGTLGGIPVVADDTLPPRVAVLRDTTTDAAAAFSFRDAARLITRERERKLAADLAAYAAHPFRVTLTTYLLEGPGTLVVKLPGVTAYVDRADPWATEAAVYASLADRLREAWQAAAPADVEDHIERGTE